MSEQSDATFTVGDLCTFRDAKDWRGKDHAVRIVTAVKANSYHLGVPRAEDCRVVEKEKRHLPDTIYTRVPFSKVVPYQPPTIVESTRTCAACQRSFLASSNWNTVSSCCSEACSNNLPRPCRREECKQTFTRTTRLSYFCSCECADTFNREHSYAYCPLFM